MRCCNIVFFYISHNCCNISAYCHHDNFRRHSIPMACHNTLVIPSACAIGVVTPSSYSLNIMIGYYHGHQFDKFDAFASSDVDASVSLYMLLMMMIMATVMMMMMIMMFFSLVMVRLIKTW